MRGIIQPVFHNFTIFVVVGIAIVSCANRLLGNWDGIFICVRIGGSLMREVSGVNCEGNKKEIIKKKIGNLFSYSSKIKFNISRISG